MVGRSGSIASTSSVSPQLHAPNYSGKHKCHGLLMVALTDACGRLLCTSNCRTPSGPQPCPVRPLQHRWFHEPQVTEVQEVAIRVGRSPLLADPGRNSPCRATGTRHDEHDTKPQQRLGPRWTRTRRRRLRRHDRPKTCSGHLGLNAVGVVGNSVWALSKRDHIPRGQQFRNVCDRVRAARPPAVQVQVQVQVQASQLVDERGGRGGAGPLGCVLGGWTFPYDLLEVHREAVRNPSPRHPA